MMKKIMKLFVIVAAAAMTLASCQKNEIENPTPQEVEYTFLLGSENDVDSKATIGENSIVWESSDRLGTFTTSSTPTKNGYSYITPGKPAKFSVYAKDGLAKGDMLFFYYPYSNNAGTDKTSVTLSIPTSQDGDDDMPMASLPFEVVEESTTDNTTYAGQINLVNLAAIAEFNVFSSNADYQSEKVQSVTFSSDKALAGSFSFDLTSVNYSDKTTLAIQGYTEKSVVASITPSAVASPSAPATKVNMVVAPGTYTGTVVVKTDKASYAFNVSKAKEFARSTVKPLAVDLAKGERTLPQNSEYTIQWASNSEWTDSYTKLVSGDYTVQTVKNNGSTAPTVNASANDCRVYAKGSITVTNSAANIKKLVFNISTQGKKRLAEITASVGTVTVDATNAKVIWEGDSNTITFTVGDTADYGTEADKAGQLCFSSIDAIAAMTTDEPENPGTEEPEVAELSSISVSDDAKTEYTVGDLFVKPTVTATYSDGSTKEVDAEFTGYVMTVADTYTVNVSYTENEVTVTDSYEIVVNAKEDAEIVAHTVTWDLSKNQTSEASESKLAWDADGVSMANAKETSQTPATNYYPGTIDKTYTSTRFYKGNKLTIAPKQGYAIKSVVFTATSTNYANDFAGSTWTNAVAVVSETTVTINPEDGREDILASITGTCGFTKVVVDLVPSEGYVKPVVVLSSITLSGQTTNYTVGDPFEFTGSVTAVYSNGATKPVTPTKVSNPDMSTAGEKKVTVTYVEDEVSVSADYTITVAEKVVEPEEPEQPSTTPKFVKVTTAPSDWSGTYLIVYESGKVAFDGSRTTLDATSNTKAVTIANGEIEATDAMMDITFDIAKDGTSYTIKSKSGYYIGNNSDSNALTSNKSTKYVNTISLNADKTAQIVGKGKSVLRYNANSGQTRFRYFKSSTYTGQKAICLYKLED